MVMVETHALKLYHAPASPNPRRVRMFLAERGICVPDRLSPNVLGDIAFSVDDKPLAFHETVTYRGMMFTGVPNMAWVFGYFRASWTLRADLVGDFLCRLLKHMQAIGAKRVEVALRPEDKDMPILPWIDPQ